MAHQMRNEKIRYEQRFICLLTSLTFDTSKNTKKKSIPQNTKFKRQIMNLRLPTRNVTLRWS